jgi:hypothetical protein
MVTLVHAALLLFGTTHVLHSPLLINDSAALFFQAALLLESPSLG